jgi:hypothetical protein
MEKYEFDGRRYVRVADLRKEISSLRKTIPDRYDHFDNSQQAMVHLAYNDILRALYREEIAVARTPDELREIMNMDKE